MILLLDNYDSFVYNLDRYFQRLGQQTLVVRSDAIGVDAIERLGCEAIVLSPGPKTPDEAGCSLEVVRKLGASIPILGVCLGHQAIGQAFGGRVIRAPQAIHGMASSIVHDSSRLFVDVPSPFQAARYHSLLLEPETLPAELRVTARTSEGLIMAVEHQRFPIYGLQFHPESILTEHGYEILRNFLIANRIACSETIPPRDLEALV